jgi:hypothetical protein
MYSQQRRAALDRCSLIHFIVMSSHVNTAGQLAADIDNIMFCSSASRSTAPANPDHSVESNGSPSLKRRKYPSYAPLSLFHQLRSWLELLSLYPLRLSLSRLLRLLLLKTDLANVLNFVFVFLISLLLAYLSFAALLLRHQKFNLFWTLLIMMPTQLARSLIVRKKHMYISS